MKSSKLFVLSCFLIAFFLVSICATAHSQEWITANQFTITWDVVTELSDGTPFPEGDIIEYRLWLSNAVTDPDKTSPVEVAVIPVNTYVLTMGVEGRYFVGLQTIRKITIGADGEERVIGESVIGWTDDPEIAAGGAIFGLQYYLPPATVHGIRIL